MFQRNKILSMKVLRLEMSLGSLCNKVRMVRVDCGRERIERKVISQLGFELYRFCKLLKDI